MNQNKTGKYIPFFGCMISVKYPQFEAAVRKTVDSLGVTLVDVDGFTCCPDPIYFQASDKMNWLTIAARNLCLAEDEGLDIITMCSGCTATLSETRHILTTNMEIRDKVNERLKKINREYKGTSSVRHIVTVLRDDYGIDKVAKTVTYPLDKLTVAIHYGCHLLKPSNIMKVDDPDRPTILEDLVNATGAKALNHEERILCCGKSCENEEMPPRMVFDILTSVEKLNADCMCLICPTCFDEYDLGQIKIGRLFQKKFNLPVLYYFQLLGLAQGLSPDEVGLSRHKIKATKLVEKLFAEEAPA